MSNVTEQEIVNIYCDGGVWCYAMFVGGEYDHSDTLGAETESEARKEAKDLFPSAEVNRVADTN